MKREIKFVPFIMPDNESTLEILFQIIGELGIVEFQLATNWYTSEMVNRRLDSMKKDVFQRKEDHLLKYFWMGPQPLDVCYFSSIRKSEDDVYWEDGAGVHVSIIPVYYGYKYVNEDNGVWTTDFVYQKLLREGNDGVWNYLEKYYVEIFGELR